MSSKLGYTWYPKDFISDPDVMFMTSAERGVYRDLIDLAYMSDNAIRYNVEMLAKYTNSDVETVQKVLDIKGKKKGEMWTIPSCDKRLDLANKNRANGSKGGRPKTEAKPKNNPVGNNSDNPNETQTQRQREREREREKEIEVEREIKKCDNSPAAATPIPVFKQVFESMDKVMKSILDDENSLMDIGAVAKIPNPEDVSKLIEEFCTYQKATEKFHTDRPEFKRHFFSWYAKKYPNNAPATNSGDSNSPPSVEGVKEEERSGKWIWLNGGWRDTTTFPEHRKLHYGIK